MNILHVVIGRPKPETSNGVLKSVYNLSVNQGSMGHTINVLAIRNKPFESDIKVSDRVTIHLYQRHRLRFVLDSRLLAYIKSHYQQIDIVHFHGGYHPEYWKVSGLLNKFKIPFFLSPRGGYQKIANKRNYLLKKIYKNLFEMRVVRSATKIHALNAQEESDINSYGVDPLKIITIPNGVDVEAIKETKEKLSSQVDSEDDGIFSIVYCGRIDAYYKGLDVLVEALDILINKRNRTNLQLKLIGPDWKGGAKTIEDRVQQYALGRYVVFYGAQYGLDKYKIYSESSVFILPSRTEGMPTSVLEAMAYSMPCIVTPETNVDKRILDNGGCYFVELGAENIANAIEKFMEDKQALYEMGLKGLEWVENHYTYYKVAQQYVNYYQAELSG